MLNKRSKAVRAGLVKDSIASKENLELKRREWEEAALSIPIADGVGLKDTSVASVPCLWVRPKLSTSSDTDIIVYVHGGGMVEGSPKTHQEFASRLASTLDMRVLMVDYRLSPEHPFPSARADVVAVLEEVLSTESDLTKVHAGGDSSGAGLLLSALLSLKSRKIVLTGRMFLISGVYDHTFSGDTIKDLADKDPSTSLEVLEHYAALYAAGQNLSDPGISPLFADLSGLPEALILVGSEEILLSDSSRMHEALAREGIPSNLIVYEGMWHAWPLYSALDEAQSAIVKIRRHLDVEQ